MNNKYIKPKSATWWIGLALAIGVPLLKYLGVDLPDNIQEQLLGAGLITLRAAQG